MSNIGEIKTGREINLCSLSHKYIWVGCPNCGKERWVSVYEGHNIRCRSCCQQGERNHNWGKITSEYTKAKMRASSHHFSPFRGKHHTDEAKRKCRLATLGRIISNESKEKISISLFGKYLNGKSGCWEGGRYDNGDGSIRLWIHPDDIYAKMVQRGKGILESRLTMAKYLGRCLEPDERVCHLNGVKSDNQIENLKLFPNMSKLMRFLRNRSKVNA